MAYEVKEPNFWLMKTNQPTQLENTVVSDKKNKTW